MEISLDDGLFFAVCTSRKSTLGDRSHLECISSPVEQDCIPQTYYVAFGTDKLIPNLSGLFELHALACLCFSAVLNVLLLEERS